MDFPGAGPLWLTVRLGLVTVLVLLVIGTPLAWWLARTHRRFKPIVEAIVSLPIVLPPTVVGFYLLILLGPNGAIDRKSTRLNSSHVEISYAVFCLKKKIT